MLIAEPLICNVVAPEPLFVPMYIFFAVVPVPILIIPVLVVSVPILRTPPIWLVAISI